MNSIQALWEKGQCIILNGVMYANGSVELVKAYDLPRPVGTLSLPFLEQTSLDWNKTCEITTLIPSCRSEDLSRGVVAIGGEGGMGGDGFLALTDVANRLLWIAFFDFSNPFVFVEIARSEIIAKNNLEESWHFQIAKPSQIIVEVPPEAGFRSRTI